MKTVTYTILQYMRLTEHGSNRLRIWLDYMKVTILPTVLLTTKMHSFAIIPLVVKNFSKVLGAYSFAIRTWIIVVWPTTSCYADWSKRDHV